MYLHFEGIRVTIKIKWFGFWLDQTIEYFELQFNPRSPSLYGMECAF